MEGEFNEEAYGTTQRQRGRSRLRKTFLLQILCSGSPASLVYFVVQRRVPFPCGHPLSLFSALTEVEPVHIVEPGISVIPAEEQEVVAVHHAHVPETGSRRGPSGINFSPRAGPYENHNNTGNHRTREKRVISVYPPQK